MNRLTKRLTIGSLIAACLALCGCAWIKAHIPDGPVSLSGGGATVNYDPTNGTWMYFPPMPEQVLPAAPAKKHALEK